MFFDLRGFTSFTELAEPEELFEVLREYHVGLGELIPSTKALSSTSPGTGSWSSSTTLSRRATTS